jgi:hypothetical protein
MDNLRISVINNECKIICPGPHISYDCDRCKGTNYIEGKIFKSDLIGIPLLNNNPLKKL